MAFSLHSTAKRGFLFSRITKSIFSFNRCPLSISIPFYVRSHPRENGNTLRADMPPYFQTLSPNPLLDSNPTGKVFALF